MSNPFHEKFGGRSDSEWLQAMILACGNNVVDDVTFPTSPDQDVQRMIQGNSQEIAIRGAMQFFRYVRDMARKHARPVGNETRLLDFASGWGRMVRPFMRDMSLERIYAVEPSAVWCRIARGCNPYVGFVQSDYMPPLPFKDCLFDHVIGYSIFTHLPETMFDAWMEELARVTQVDGILVFTFLGEGLMRTLAAYPDGSAADQSVHFWHRILLNALQQQPNSRELYNRDEYLFLRTQDSESYGDTFMSSTLLRRKLERRFDVLEVQSDVLAQDVMVLARRASG